MTNSQHMHSSIIEYAQSAIRDYGAPVYWNVGTLFCHEDITQEIVSMCRKFSIPNPISWAFGSVHSLMAGGRVPPYDISLHDALSNMERHLENGIACRLTLSNPYIDEKMIEDDFIDRRLLKFLNANSSGRKRNGVILSSDALARHVKECYPNLDVILSIIRTAYDVGHGPEKDTFEWYSKLLDNPLYDVVVVNSAKLYLDGFLETLPHKDKVELIVCHDCIRNCPMAKNHYEISHLYNECRARGVDPSKAVEASDKIKKACKMQALNPNAMHASYSIEEIRKVVSMGYNQFKIAGRTSEHFRIARDLWHYLFNHEVMRHLEGIVL